MDSKNLNLYFREIIYQSPEGKKDSVCGVFSYEATNAEDANLGNLYLVGKISNIPKRKRRNSDFLLNLLASAIKRDFYSNHQKNTLEALESALQGANIYLSDFTKKGHNEWINNLHFSIMAFHNDDIFIGQTGEIMTQLFRNGSMTNISKKFQIEEISDPAKTFSNIANGKIEKGDKIIVSTVDVLELVSSQTIKDLMSYHTTEKLYHHIKNELNKVKSLACLILEAETEPPKNGVEELEPKIEQDFSVNFKGTLDAKAEKINQSIKNQITFLDRFTILLLKHHTLKYIFGLILILILILSPYLVSKINYDIRIRRINSLLSRINENIERSENSLIYQSQTDAQSFLRQAEQMLTDAYSIFQKLPQGAQEKISQNLQLAKEGFEKQKNSLNNTINVDNLEKLADLSQNTYSFNPKGILKLSTNIYLYELSSGFLYKLDLIDNSSKLIFLSSNDTFKLGAINNDKILLLSNPEKISVYDLTENYNIYLLKPNLENTLNIKDMCDFEQEIFFLDTEKSSIYKYTQTGDILNGVTWINSDELKNSQSLAIDGSIFVSLNNGIINVYAQGKKTKEIKLDLSPALNKGGELFTNAALKNLYVLDQPNNRIIAYNKKDSFIKQFVIPELNNLRDFWVDYGEETIYLLNGLEVYRIEI